MNKHQIKLIEIVKKHLDQEVSIEQMRRWLVRNIRPIAFSSKTLIQPGVWLELYTYRTIRGHILYLEDQTISRGSDLDWYWEDVRRVLNLLVGNRVYRKTVHWLEFPLEDKIREDDKWMLPYLKHVEETIQILATQSEESPELHLPKLDLVFESKPLYLQTGAEIVLGQMLDIIEDYQDLMSNSARLPDHFYSIDLKTVHLSQLEKLVRCFKGELPYSLSATFEGLDRFAITLLV